MPVGLHAVQDQHLGERYSSVGDFHLEMMIVMNLNIRSGCC